MVKQATFFLIKTNLNALKVVESVKSEPLVEWATVAYGPYQVVAYIECNDEKQMAQFIENLRSRRYITELDARRVKIIPKDNKLKSFKIIKKVSAVLLVGVDYKEEKERVVTWNLREVKGVVWARAMWGPTDIVAIVQADNHESMRNLICDDIKTMKGVKSNSTLYCYPHI